MPVFRWVGIFLIVLLILMTLSDAWAAPADVDAGIGTPLAPAAPQTPAAPANASVAQGPS